MLVHECMTKNVELVDPNMSVKEAASKMKSGDFGILPVGENDRLIGMITDRDIAVRAVSDGKDPSRTAIREIMSRAVLYCYEDQSIEEVAKNMGDNQVRRLPVLSRQKRLVGILSLGDIAFPKEKPQVAGEALGQISEHCHREPSQKQVHVY